MLLPDGYHDLPRGKLAAVVTYLELRAPSPPASRVQVGDATGRGPAVPDTVVTGSPAPWMLRQVSAPAPDWYRDLYRRVGEPWLWSSRLVMPDDALRAILGSPDVEVHALVADGRDEGLLELDFRVPDACEIAFFGLTPALTGRGAGRWLMARALARAWERPVSRVWLHTCSLDSPRALDFYRRAGFTPYARRVEVLDDPRLLGVLPETAAPQVPLLRP